MDRQKFITQATKALFKYGRLWFCGKLYTYYKQDNYFGIREFENGKLVASFGSPHLEDVMFDFAETLKTGIFAKSEK